MREVFIHKDFTMVGFYRSILESAGIPCFIRNERPHHSITASRRISSDPTLCVTHEEDYEQAMELIREASRPDDSNTPDWRCPQCKEEVPGSFAICWQCGAEAPESL